MIFDKSEFNRFIFKLIIYQAGYSVSGKEDNIRFSIIRQIHYPVQPYSNTQGLK